MSSSASSRASRSGCSSGWKAALTSREGLWTLWPIALFFAVLATAFASGCGRTVLVNESSPIRTGPSVEGRVYAWMDGKWVLSANKVTIPEGWYLVPPSFVEDER